MPHKSNIMNTEQVKAKVNYNVPFGDNAFGVIGGWQKAARKAGWTPAQIKEVVEQAMSGDYQNLCKVIDNNSN